MASLEGSHWIPPRGPFAFPESHFLSPEQSSTNLIQAPSVLILIGLSPWVCFNAPHAFMAAEKLLPVTVQVSLQLCKGNAAIAVPPGE